MHRRAVPSLQRAHYDESTEGLATESDEPVTPIRSQDGFLPARTGRAGSLALLPTSGLFCFLSLVLHSLLVVIHVILLGIWAKGLEHRVTFSLANQKIVSFLITAISTTIGTVYSASLVFITQTLSMRRSLQRDQTLTETHDNAAAWAGIGSALVHLWRQKTVPASISGVLSTFFYLSSVLILHITTPALFSLEAFTATRPVPVQTQGLPSYNWTDPVADIYDHLPDFLPQPLALLPTVFENIFTTLGLHNGSMYDVLAVNEGTGNATVNGTGFNITCGYLPDIALALAENSTTLWNVSGPAFGQGWEIIYPTQPGIIVPINRTFFDTVLFYSTIPILDSAYALGPTYDLVPPLYNATSSIQIFGCSQSRMNQTVTVDSQSRTALSLTPDLEKTTSTWSVYTGPVDSLESTTVSPGFNTTGNLFLELWGNWYKLIPSSEFPLAYDSSQMISFADLQLNQMLNLVSWTDRPQNVTLHAVENALSSIVASMFWTLGNIAPVQELIIGSMDSAGNSITVVTDTPPPPSAFNGTDIGAFFERPFLLLGNATVSVVSAETRLNLSIIAVVAGLVISIALLLLSLPSALFHRENGANLPIQGMGMLHSMWLYRNHRELETLLEQVDHPTDDRLRAAGMVRTTLVEVRSDESFLMVQRESHSPKLEQQEG
ncbi:hypothetical protein MSAN_00115200 [Mycena sanguinolenta]|uniref:Transmembrane protein n=1 Tax=Mycena sanguinolenta TaxID=230812 RepID=A0A8H7DIU2_9AGAR|nr:hypothetical protein MSAN_00115200 [Mycena sanguinolenta]